MDFQITSNDLKAFRELMKNAPFAMQKVTANALNALGASLKTEVVKTLNQTMTIRNRSFPASQTMVFKTSPGRSIESQNVIVGSKHTNKFSGWAENEEGGASERNRVIMLFARGGNKANVVPKSNRISQAIADADSEGISGSEGNRVYGLIALLARQSYTGLVRVGGKFKGGIYRFGKPLRATRDRKKPWFPKINKVQQPGEHIDVGAKHWMRRSVDNLMGNTNYEKLWENALIEAITRAKQKAGL
jgi:hypothetical protein